MGLFSKLIQSVDFYWTPTMNWVLWIILGYGVSSGCSKPKGSTEAYQWCSSVVLMLTWWCGVLNFLVRDWLWEAVQFSWTLKTDEIHEPTTPTNCVTCTIFAAWLAAIVVAYLVLSHILSVTFISIHTVSHLSSCIMVYMWCPLKAHIWDNAKKFAGKMIGL